MLRLAAGFRDQRHDVGERLTRLRDEIVALEYLLGVPADLAGEENEAAFGRNAVGEAFGLFPGARVEEVVEAQSLTPPASGGSAGFFRLRFSAARR